MKRIVSKVLSVSIIILLSISVFSACAGKKNPIESLSLYELDIKVDTDKYELSVTQNVTYQNNTDNTLSVLKFNLYPNAFREDAVYKPYNDMEVKRAFPSGINYGNISISNILDEWGKPLGYQVNGVDKNILSIGIPELFLGCKITIKMNFTVKLTKSTLRLGYTNNSINIANFYPVLCVYENGYYEQPYHSNGDPFYSDVSNYKVNVTYPENYKIATTGIEILRNNIGNGRQMLTFEAEKVRDFAIALSDKYSVITDAYEGVKINYFYFDDANYEKSIETAKQSIATYSTLFGKYPYAEFDVCQVDFLAGGMEYPNLVYIGNTDDYDFYTEVIVHETAHQWWYGVVGSNEIDYAWLDEGLTELSTAIYYKKNGDISVYNEKINDSYTSYTMFVELSAKIEKTNTSMSRPSYGYSTDTEYYYATYVKGLIMFDTIYEIIGEEKFYKAMQFYFQQNYMKNATPSDLSACIKKAVGFDCDKLINRWTEGDFPIFAFAAGYR